MAGPDIHPTAIVAEGARLADGVTVGPFSIVGEHVEVGEGTSIGPHVVLTGHTRLGRGNRLFQFASVGAEPQDLKYRGTPTRLEIGDRNTFRESVTVHTGTEDGGGVTRIGSDNLMMAYSHVAHDCQVGDHVVMANGATLAGHVRVEDFAIVGGLVAVHQFVRIGESAILGGGAMVNLDIAPYCIASGDRARLHGLNLVGLRRRGLDEDVIRRLRAAYRTLFQQGMVLREALALLRREHGEEPAVMHLVEFIEGSERGICR